MSSWEILEEASCTHSQKKKKKEKEKRGESTMLTHLDNVKITTIIMM